MNVPDIRNRERGVSHTMGALLLVSIAVTLAGVALHVTDGISSSAEDSAAVHGVGDFDVEFHESGGDHLLISPGTLAPRNTTYALEVNDNRVREWGGQDVLEITCLYPGDRLEILSEKGDTTYPVRERVMKRSLRCNRLTAIPDKFQYAFINEERVEVQSEYRFSIGIDPDGPGSDGGPGNVFQRDIGTIPVTNEWHYIRRYERSVEGFEPPVWVIVMTDNVHWNSTGGGRNWTQDAPGEPGINSYYLNSSGNVVLTPGGSEPTNDIYMVFKPGCSGSELMLVDESAGYDNRIYINGQVAIDNTNSVSEGTVLDAPGVNCPSSG